MNELETLLGTELLKQVTEKLGDKKILLDDGKLFPKHRFDEVNKANQDLQKQIDELQKSKSEAIDKAVADYKKQLDDVQKQLKKLEKSSGDNEVLQKQLADYQTELKTKVEEFEATRKTEKETYQKELAKQKLDLMIENELIKAQAKNTKAVKALLDHEKIKIDGENIIGLRDQVDILKKNDPYLFGETTLNTPNDPRQSGVNPQGFYTSAQIESMTDEQIQANMDAIIKSQTKLKG